MNIKTTYTEFINERKVNEISTQAGLDDVIKGSTSSIEGIKMSSELAQGIKDWIHQSAYGRKYSKHILKGRLVSVLQPANNWGIERYLSGKTKKEWKDIVSKHISEGKLNEATWASKWYDQYDKFREAMKGMAKIMKKHTTHEIPFQKAWDNLEDVFQDMEIVEGKVNEGGPKPRKPGEWAKEYSHLETKDIYKKGDHVVYVRDKGGPWESGQTDVGVIKKTKRGLYVGMNAYTLTDGDEITQSEILGLSETNMNESAKSIESELNKIQSGVSVSEREPGVFRAKWSYMKRELSSGDWKAALKIITNAGGKIDKNWTINDYEANYDREEPAEWVPSIYYTLK